MSSRETRRVDPPHGWNLRGMGFLGILLYASLFFSACGACWPGSCLDAPSPEPTPSGDCEISRQPEAISPYLWQAANLEEDSNRCPRLLLDPADPRYDDAELCEIGVRNPDDDTVGTAFFVRYDCDSRSPWEMVLTDPANPTDFDDDLELFKSCPDSPLDQTEIFKYGQALESELWSANESEIRQVVTDWEEDCRAEDVSEERRAACSQVCERVDKGPESGISLRVAFSRFDIATSPGVDCYLALFDEVPASAGASIGTSEGSSDPILGTSACLCRPNDLFFNIVTADCFPDGSSYDQTCGESAWIASESSGASCAPVPTQ